MKTIMTREVEVEKGYKFVHSVYEISVDRAKKLYNAILLDRDIDSAVDGESGGVKWTDYTCGDNGTVTVFKSWSPHATARWFNYGYTHGKTVNVFYDENVGYARLEVYHHYHG